MPNLTVLLPREIRVTREQRERLVLSVTFGFQPDHEGGGKDRGEALPREWLLGSLLSRTQRLETADV